MARASWFVSTFLLLILPACGRGAPPSPTARRVVVVGVDGATWSIASPLMAAGRMPRLAQLYRAGSAGALRSLKGPDGEPLDRAALWTSLVTGRPPGAHGVTGSAEKIPGRYALRPVTASRRAVPALWTIAGARGVSVGVAGWPVTFPVERTHGFMIADGYDPPLTAHRGYLYPPEALGEGGTGGEELHLSDRAARVAALDGDLQESFRRDLGTLSRALALYRVYQPRVAFLWFESVDRASHRFWQYHERRYLEVQVSRGRPPEPEKSAKLAEAIPGAYEFFDEWVGMLLGRIPEGTTVIVVSVHGFRGVEMIDYIHLDLDLMLGSMGLLARGPGGAADWTGTRLFDLDGSATARRDLYLNLTGREERGIVEPSSSDRLREKLALELRALRTDRGEPIFRSVTPVDRPGQPDPDLEAIENLGIDPSAVVGLGASRRRVTSLYRRYSEDFGTHDATGILLAAGDGIAKGHTGWSAGLYDAAPTILGLLGIDPSADMPGSPIGEILVSPPGADSRRVPSFDDLGGGPAPLHRSDAAAERELMRMRSLSHLR